MISNPFALSSSGVFGCCWALRPRYKRLVDNIFPEDPEVGSKSSSHLLFFKSDAVLISPSSLSICLSYRGLMKHCNNIVAKELLYKQKSENLYYCYWKIVPGVCQICGQPRNTQDVLANTDLISPVLCFQATMTLIYTLTHLLLCLVYILYMPGYRNSTVCPLAFIIPSIGRPSLGLFCPLQDCKACILLFLLHLG